MSDIAILLLYLLGWVFLIIAYKVAKGVPNHYYKWLHNEEWKE